MINLHEHVAILIDADNGSLSYIEQILKFADYYGELKICRAYGDWENARLSSHREKLEALKIDLIQVDQVGKNATDHGLLMEAGQILGANFYEHNVGIFIIVSGDGDFTSACKLIQERVKEVVIIGGRQQTSNSLKAVCEKVYALEDLDQELSELEKLHPVPPSEVREYFDYLFFAYHQFARKYDWVSYTQVGLPPV